MIGRLRGILLDKRPPWLLLEVGGVSYEVEAPMSTFYQLPAAGSEVVLHTHLAVREDAHLLYGFSSERERRLFRELLKVNGVGAKVALAILSGMSVDAFVACVQRDDSAALTRLPGIGKKTAERLMVEMRDRLVDWGAVATVAVAGVPLDNASGSVAEEANAALVALGYKPADAARMVRAVDNAAELAVEEIIRRALQAVVRS